MKIVIIDGDILMYKIPEDYVNSMEMETEEDSEAIYRTIEWGSKKGIVEYLTNKINHILEGTKSRYPVICLSSPTNFRKDLNPDYKSNRKKYKPFVYNFVREYLKSNYTAFERDNLEADDLIGIIATYKGKLKGIPQGKKVIWSMDKDFNTIPAVFYKENIDGNCEKIVTTQKEADYYFMLQTLTGDSTDGYGGCPKIGKVNAQKILGNVNDFEINSAWQKVLDTYSKQGLNRDYALMQARCARILRADDYDFKTKKIKLWLETDL